MEKLAQAVLRDKQMGKYDVKDGKCPHCGFEHYDTDEHGTVFCRDCYAAVELSKDEICENSARTKDNCGCYNCKMD